MEMNEFKEHCQKKLADENINTKVYNDRLEEELKDVDNWMTSRKRDKIKELFKLKEKHPIPVDKNGSGSLILFLLEISSVDPIKENLKIIRETLEEGDCPDIDTDFDPRIRQWVKKRIVEVFGENKVCSIGSYVCYKTRAVIIDTARALGKDVNEINAVTKQMDILASFDVDDGEGGSEEQKLDQMSFDDICVHYPELGEYFERNPDVRTHAEVLRNQVKNMGKHAGGVIISNLDLTEEVSVIRDKKSGDVTSVWSEGLASRELSSIGLVKFDILGLCLEENTLIKTSEGDIAIKNIKGKSIQYLDGNGNKQYTSDFILIDSGDKELIEIKLRNGSSVKCSKEHKLFRNGNVIKAIELRVGDSILTDNDEIEVVSIELIGLRKSYDISLVNVTDLFMGEENFVLSNGIVSHNSNVSVISDCIDYIKQTTGKVISRKDIDINNKKSIKYGSKKDLVGIFQFESPATKPVADAVKMDSIHDISAVTSLIRPGPKNMGMDTVYSNRKNGEPYEKYPECVQKYLDNTFGVLAFQEQCCVGDTIVETEIGKIRLDEIVKRTEKGEQIKALCCDENLDLVYRDIVQPRRIGIKEIVRLTLNNGFCLECTPDHKVLSNRGWLRIENLDITDSILATEDIVQIKIKSIESIGSAEVYDIGVEKYHNFIANGIVTHNCMLISQSLSGFTPIESNQLRSVLAKKKLDKIPKFKEKFIKGALANKEQHGMNEKEITKLFEMIESFASYGFNLSHAISYSAVTAAEFWLKDNYFEEYMAALLNIAPPTKEKHGVKIYPSYLNYCRSSKVNILPPCVNRSGELFRIEKPEGNIGKRQLRISLSKVRMVGACAKIIEDTAPYENFADFFERVNKRKVNKRVMDYLIAANAFEIFGTRDEIHQEYFKLRKDKEIPELPTEKEWVAKEKEALGICLSVPPIIDEYMEKIKAEDWKKINDAPYVKKGLFFGRIEKITDKISKAGNPMLLIEFSDDVSQMNFYVFRNTKEKFARELRVGYVAAIPLDKFEDGDVRFYNDREKFVILERPDKIKK